MLTLLRVGARQRRGERQRGEREDRDDVKDGADPLSIGDLPERGRHQAAGADRQAEHHARGDAEVAGQQLLADHHGGREGGDRDRADEGEKQPGEQRRPGEPERTDEERDAGHRGDEHRAGADAVPQAPADERPQCAGREHHRQRGVPGRLGGVEVAA